MLLEEAAAAAGDDRRARAGAARECLAGATLEHAQPNGSAIDDLHESRVHALRKPRMALDQRTQRLDRRLPDIGDNLHRVRIAHRQRGDQHGPAVHVERLGDRIRSADERHLSRCEPRSAHVDRHFAVVLESRHDDAAGRLDANLALVRQPSLADENDEAAGTVAALLDFATVGVEYPVAEIGAFARRRHDEHLVAADA